MGVSIPVSLWISAVVSNNITPARHLDARAADVGETGLLGKTIRSKLRHEEGISDRAVDSKGKDEDDSTLEKGE
jgi:hypothetical protein